MFYITLGYDQYLLKISVQVFSLIYKINLFLKYDSWYHKFFGVIWLWQLVHPAPPPNPKTSQTQNSAALWIIFQRSKQEKRSPTITSQLNMRRHLRSPPANGEGAKFEVPLAGLARSNDTLRVFLWDVRQQYFWDQSSLRTLHWC